MASKKDTTGVRQAGDFMQTLNVLGYIHNREITNLPGQYLVQDSQDVFILNTEKVETRRGYTLLGSAKSLNLGIHSSHDWLDISSGNKLSLRAWYKTLEVFFEGDWVSIYDLPLSSHLCFTTWWNADELIDVLLWCNGTDIVSEWSGGIAKVASVTSTTITLQGYLAASDLAFMNNGAGVSGSIIRSGGGLLIYGFTAGQTLEVTGSLFNDGSYIIASVTDTVILIDPVYTLTTEAAGTPVVIQNPNSTWEARRFFTQNGGQDTDRAVTVNGQKFTYTGGESTGTLTGVSPDPSIAGVTNGDMATQTVRTYSPSALIGYEINIIFMKDNQVSYGSFDNRTIYISKNTDFADFTFTSPLRLPGEGAVIPLDSCPTAFISGPDTGNSTPTIYVMAGVSDEYRISFVQAVSSDGLGDSRVYETTPVKKLPSGSGSAAISQDSCVSIKNATAFITFDKTIDTLQNATVLPSPNSTPLSDPIKDDMLSYDLTGAQGVYIDRILWYTIPREGRIIPYDYSNQNHYWHPPQLISVSRLAIIEIDGVLTLCGHSANSNESYELFKSGVLNDNGAKFKAVAAFGYENYGSRFMKKNLDEMASELYMTKSTVVTDIMYYDYKGASGIKTFQTFGNDPATTFSPSGSASEGSDPEGFGPEGSTTDEIPSVVKVRIIHDTTKVDFYENQRRFSSDSQDAYFAIIARGENAAMSDNLPTELHK